MSNLDDLIKIGDGNAKASAIAGAIMGVAADFSGTVGAAQFIAGLFSSDSDMQDALTALQESVNNLHSQISTSDKLQRMGRIDAAMLPTINVLESVPELLSVNPPLSQKDRVDQIETCGTALTAFISFPENWQTGWFDLQYYSDPWSKTLAPENDGAVFDYVYTLPQFLRAIYIFLSVIRALEPSALENYQGMLMECLNLLESFLQTITNGIVSTRIPEAGDVGYKSETIGDTDFVPQSRSGKVHPNPLWRSQWGLSWADLAFSYGAVEIYSGFNAVRSYWDDFFDYQWLAAWLPDQEPPPGLNYNQEFDYFIRLLKLRIAGQKKSVYKRLGMPAVRGVINELRTLTGQSLLTRLSHFCG